MAQMNISIPDQLKKWVESRVADGSYASSSDYLRDLIRQEQRYQEKLGQLRSEILMGIESPISERPTSQIFSDARLRIEAAMPVKNAD
jgi:antitoxin ParD1/3/4